jgi:hypothetical protein
MKRVLAVCAFAALIVSAQPEALAWTKASPRSTALRGTLTRPSESTGVGIVAGQTVYDRSGVEVGTIEATKTDSAGKQQAVVGVRKFLGLSTRNVQIPASKLAAREAGGFAATLTSAEIERLPEIPTSSLPSPR